MFRESLQHQVMDRVAAEKLEYKQLEDLIKYAQSNIPWYAENYPKDLTSISSKKDLERLPVLTRSDVTNRFEQFIARNDAPKNLSSITTGGSTGTPLKIGLDPKLIREVPKWQILSWWNLSLAEDTATIYRGIPATGLKKLIKQFIEWPARTIHVDATNITENEILRFITEYKRIRPKVVHGYVGAMDAIADYIQSKSIELPKTKLVWTTASPISKIQEEKLKRVFGAEICDHYGCSELYYIAAECPHKRGLHIFSDHVKVEILDEHDAPMPSGEYGRIVVTNLKEKRFPLIRYANGDIGRLVNEKCTCGISLPLMDKVQGRVSENIILPNGTVLSGEYLTTIFDEHHKWVKQFQVIQKKEGSIVVKFVLYSHDDKNLGFIDKVYEQLDNRIQQQVDLKFEQVNSITQTKGKLQFIIKE